MVSVFLGTKTRGDPVVTGARRGGVGTRTGGLGVHNASLGVGWGKHARPAPNKPKVLLSWNIQDVADLRWGNQQLQSAECAAGMCTF